MSNQINLSKGQRVDLTKTNPGLSKIHVGLYWEPNTTSSGHQFDVDASAFILGANGKRLSDGHFVFYNNLSSPEGAVIHKGDERTGISNGDDEVITIDITKLPAEAESIVFVVTIDEAVTRRQTFGQIGNCGIRIANLDTPNDNIIVYDLSEDMSIETAMSFCRIYKKDGEWKVEAIGTGQAGGLAEYLNLY